MSAVAIAEPASMNTSAMTVVATISKLLSKDANVMVIPLVIGLKRKKFIYTDSMLQG